MRDDLLPLLIAAIDTPHSQHGQAGSRSDRLLITRLSRQLMEERLADPLTLRDIDSAMRFLRLLRLQAARHALARLEPGAPP